MTNAVIKKYDELVRCTQVLTEGIESEFQKFVTHQEKCRKKWLLSEEENHGMKKYMTQYQADKDTMEVRLKMARHQLDSEIRRRIKAEQSVDHMARQLSLIKELLLDKGTISDAERIVIEQSIRPKDNEPERNNNYSHNGGDSLPYETDDSLTISWDESKDDFLDLSEDLLSGKQKKTKRLGHPSAPPLPPTNYQVMGPISTDETSEDVENHGKRTRFSNEVSNGYAQITKVTQEVHKTVQNHVQERSRVSTSPSKYNPTLDRLDREFERPQKPPRRPPSKNHIRECPESSMSDTYDTDEAYDRQHPVEEDRIRFSLTRHQQALNKNMYGRPPKPYHEKLNHEKKNDEKPIAKQTTVPNLYPSLEGLGTLTKQTTVPNLHPSSDERSTPPTIKRFNTISTPSTHRKPLLHCFHTKTAVRMETCGPCKKKVRFGSNVAKCKECKAVCHPECKDKVPVPCYPTKDTPGPKDGSIECYVDKKRSPQVPDIVQQCIEEIENRGLKEQGLYRIPGVDKEVKELKEKFLRKKNPDLTKTRDMHVLCGCLKDFLRGLSEPLVTFALHESFMVAGATGDTEDSLSAMYQCVSELPQSNRETLAAIMLHLQKVALTPETQMNISNLSKVFGPTLVGHRSANPSHIEMLEDTKKQPEVVSRLLEMPADYWSQLINVSTNPSKVTNKTPPHNPNFNPNVNTPTTPECKEAPISLLGPINGSSTNGQRNTKMTYTPKLASKEKDGKRTRHFFNSPS